MHARAFSEKITDETVENESKKESNSRTVEQSKKESNENEADNFASKKR